MKFDNGNKSTEEKYVINVLIFNQDHTVIAIQGASKTSVGWCGPIIPSLHIGDLHQWTLFFSPNLTVSMHGLSYSTPVTQTP
jgi:hypothetical protein